MFVALQLGCCSCCWECRSLIADNNLTQFQLQLPDWQLEARMNKLTGIRQVLEYADLSYKVMESYRPKS